MILDCTLTDAEVRRNNFTRASRKHEIDLQEIAGKLYDGPAFEAWFIKSNLGTNFLFRLAEETGVVLLPGNGFEIVDTSAKRIVRKFDRYRIHRDREVYPTDLERIPLRL